MNSTINTFIIDTVLIDPIEDIISKLKNKEFRDCDIKWLDIKIENFTKFACETLNIKGVLPSEIPNQGFKILNEYVYEKYLDHFTTLLNYFKSF